MTLRSRGKRKPIGVFDYTDEDERIEEVSKELLRKFDSPVTKTSCAIDKYDFLRCFAQNTKSESKQVDRIVINVEGKVPAKEEPSSCELSGDGTGDLIDVISNGSHGRIGIDASTSSSMSENDEEKARKVLVVWMQIMHRRLDPIFLFGFTMMIGLS